MNITDLIEKPEAEIPRKVWGIKLNDTVLGLPKKLKFMAVVAEFEDETKSKLNQEFIGKLVNLLLTRSCDVAVEIPADHNLNIKTTVLMANTMQFSLSMLFDESLQEKYIEDARDITEVMLTTKSFSQTVFPISSYLGYLSSNALRTDQQKKEDKEKEDSTDQVPEHGAPDDDYILQVFVKKMPKPLVDGFKLATFEAVESVFGSINNFNKAIVTSAVIQAEEFRAKLEDIREEQCDSPGSPLH